MEIVHAKDEDIKIIADMTRQLFEDEPSDRQLTNEEFENRLQEYLAHGCQAFLFLEDDITGYALVNMLRHPYYLIDFFICRNSRRGGKGTLALNSLMSKLDTKSIDLDVFCWNDRGKKFWESVGFKERAIIMRKEIFE